MYKRWNSNFDKFPNVEVKGYENQAFNGYEDVVSEIRSKLCNKRNIITVESYPAVRNEEIIEAFNTNMDISEVIIAEDFALTGDEITQLIERNITDDRVFGVISHHNLEEFFNSEKIQENKLRIDAIEEGNILIIGTGATLIYEPTILVYADLARWEIQQRYRSGEFGNWKMDNHDEDILRKYKRAFFIEWRVADRFKKGLFDSMDYILDTNKKDDPKMITIDAFNAGMELAVNRPFRVVPFFDPGVWGGQWMKKICGLDEEKENYAWCFDCVPEENSLNLKFGDTVVELPSINLVFKEPVKLLGDTVHARFGAEFPIRFDFLDTMEGQNLSLQVHPLTEYIQDSFGMHYTQDESYYMLDTGDDACVYLGTKEGINPDDMIRDLKEAEEGRIVFPDEKYINKFPAKKHDHFLIPAGTVHCSGSNSMVLEISATPYIFTFKLWDWERVGLDGLPRPVHIDHGKENIQWNRNTKWVEDNLVNRVDKIAESDGVREERTGLHEREFIETRRHWFNKEVLHNTNGSVNVINLVEGKEAIVESPSGQFEPFVVHYAETFIIPENVKSYTIRPYGESEGKEIATLKAYVR